MPTSPPSGLSHRRPPLLINSLPKSGTHILSRAAELHGFSQHFDQEDALSPSHGPPAFLSYRRVLNALTAQGVAPAGSDETGICVGTQTPLPVPVDHMQRWLGAIGPGRYIISHIAHSASLTRVLRAVGMKHLFIIREPRSVLNSLLDFVLDTGEAGGGRHFLRADFQTMDLEQRVDLILDGGPAPRAGVQVRPFASIYLDMLAWRDDPDCLVVTFEELVGPAGGGRADWQRAAFARIAEHLGQPPDPNLDAQAEALYSRSARTFRRGRVDGWEIGLSPAVANRITEACVGLRATFEAFLALQTEGR